MAVKSNARRFSSCDIEIFLSTISKSFVVDWPDQARLKLLVVPSGEGEAVKISETFCNNIGKHCEEVGLDDLKRYMRKVQSALPQKIVFIQNYGPCRECADLLNLYQKRYPNTEMSIVYVKEYTEDGLEKLDNSIHKCHMTSWRWIHFLLWNLGELEKEGQVVPWWQGEYDQHEEVINEGLKRCSIETDSIDSPEEEHMRELLLKNGVGSESKEINVYYYESTKRYTLDEIVRIVDPSYQVDTSFIW